VNQDISVIIVESRGSRIAHAIALAIIIAAICAAFWAVYRFCGGSWILQIFLAFIAFAVSASISKTWAPRTVQMTAPQALQFLEGRLRPASGMATINATARKE
jgi:hypothetical protein